MANLTRWHINAKQEVGKCNATVGTCPFGGASGTENHFASQEAAEVFLAKSNPGFSPLGTKTKRRRVPLGRVKPETRSAVEDLLDAGVRVNAPKSLDNLNGTSLNTSSVDILDESLEGVSLESIRKNRPF